MGRRGLWFRGGKIERSLYLKGERGWVGPERRGGKPKALKKVASQKKEYFWVGEVLVIPQGTGGNGGGDERLLGFVGSPRSNWKV